MTYMKLLITFLVLAVVAGYFSETADYLRIQIVLRRIGLLLFMLAILMFLILMWSET